MGSQTRRIRELVEDFQFPYDRAEKLTFAEEDFDEQDDWSNALWDLDQGLKRYLNVDGELPLGEPEPDPTVAFIERTNYLIAQVIEKRNEIVRLLQEHFKEVKA